MSTILIIVLVTVALVVTYVLFTYNNFVTIRVRIRASIQEIGNQLKRQANLIPNLEAGAKAYLKHEKGIFEKLTEARKAIMSAQKSGSLDQAERASQLISQVIPQIRVAVESNPEIRGADVVRQLMDELRDTADKVMYSRRTLIDLAADYNSLRVQFPSNIVANMFGFSEEKGLAVSGEGEHLEVKPEELKTPRVKL